MLFNPFDVSEYLLQHESMDGETFRRLREHDGLLPAPESEANPVSAAPVPPAPADVPAPGTGAEPPADPAPEGQDEL